MGKVGQCCCDECECITGDPPEMTISGFTGGGWSTAGNCCFKQVFTPNTSQLSQYCSDPVSRYEITRQCDSDYYVVDYTGIACNTIYKDTHPPCPDAIAGCCSPAPSWVLAGSSSGQSKLTIETHHLAYHQLLSVTVYLRRDIILCDGVPTCKWMLILEYRIAYKSTWSRGTLYEYSQTVTSAGPCFTVNDAYNVNCEVSNPVDCDDVFESTTMADMACTSQGTMCIHRIKFFDTFPSGTHSFSASDVPGPGTCAAPPNDMNCPECEWDFTSTVCLEPGVVCPPPWCTTPPIVTTTPTTYTIPGRQCASFQVFTDCANSCDGFLSVCFTPVTCPDVSITLDCDSVEFPWEDPEYVPPEECEGCEIPEAGGGIFPLIGLPSECNYGEQPRFMLCGCTGSFGGPPIFTKACNALDPPCDPNCCYTCFDCPGCPQCFTKYSTLVGAGTLIARSGTIDFTISCVDLLSEPDYCFSPPPITVTLGALP